MRQLRLPVALAAATLLIISGRPAAAQQSYPAAAAIPPVLEELERIRPVADGGFTVRNVQLDRAGGVFTFIEGRVWPLTQVNGRVVGAVFRGTAQFTLGVTSPVEQERLKFYLGREAPLVDTITHATFFFADSTLEELRRGSTPAPTDEPPGMLRDQAGRALLFLRWYKDRTWDAEFLEPIVNGRVTEMFRAQLERRRGEELWFSVDPDAPEQVSLAVRDRAVGSEVGPEVVVQFARPDRPAPARDARRREAAPTAYTLDVRMPQALDGGVAFSATATMTLQVPEGGAGPWIPFTLYRELEVDSARWEGAAAPYFMEKDTYHAWVRAPGPLAAGSTPTVVMHYHGDPLERYGDWFSLKASTLWYPNSVDGRAKASFDITYHAPIGHPLGSIGQMVDSSVSGRLVTTRWVHETPMRNASFNIGRFEVVNATVPGSPPITLLWSQVGHRELTRALQLSSIRDVRGVMIQEVGAAMKFFSHVYGPPQEPAFYVTEIPDFHGEAFPGLVHLSFLTFVDNDTIIPTGNVGFDESFRGHEVGHQWWGISVDYASYRDRWLSEGIAEFSGLWYLQARSNATTNYLNMLREYRGNLVSLRGVLGATSLGHRNANGREPKYYGYAVYEKGAWIMHMLRTLMMQLGTMNEDKFTAAMREFYTTYRGRSASTDDFRVVMEKHAGADLSWFFDQWVDGTSIPAYRWAWRAEAGEGGQHRVRIRVKQTQAPDSFQMFVPVTVELRDGRALRTRIRVAGPLTEVELPPLPGEVRTVRFNDFEGVLAEVSTENW